MRGRFENEQEQVLNKKALEVILETFVEATDRIMENKRPWLVETFAASTAVSSIKTCIASACSHLHVLNIVKQYLLLGEHEMAANNNAQKARALQQKCKKLLFGYPVGAAREDECLKRLELLTSLGQLTLDDLAACCGLAPAARDPQRELVARAAVESVDKKLATVSGAGDKHEQLELLVAHLRAVCRHTRDYRQLLKLHGLLLRLLREHFGLLRPQANAPGEAVQLLLAFKQPAMFEHRRHALANAVVVCGLMTAWKAAEEQERPQLEDFHTGVIALIKFLKLSAFGTCYIPVLSRLISRLSDLLDVAKFDLNQTLNQTAFLDAAAKRKVYFAKGGVRAATPEQKFLENMTKDT